MEAKMEITMQGSRLLAGLRMVSRMENPVESQRGR